MDYQTPARGEESAVSRRDTLKSFGLAGLGALGGIQANAGTAEAGARGQKFDRGGSSRASTVTSGSTTSASI